MNLNVADWKPFKIQRTESQKGLFEIENCKCGSAGQLEDGSDINYIGAKKSDNGVMRSVSLDGNTDLVSKGHGIMFICDGEGSVGYTNYMDSDFIGSTTTSIGYDDALTETNAMFLVSILDNEKFKYSYGRKYRKKLINAEIYLPVQHNADGSIFIDDTKKYSDEGYVPDWQFMEDYIKSLHHKPLTTRNKSGQAPKLNVSEWKRFYLDKLFTIKKGKRLTAEDQEDGKNIYIGAIDSNNGVANYIGQMPIHKGNTISLSYNGSVGESFYQPEPYWATDDVNALYPKFEKFNQYIGLFFATIIRQEKYRFSYGRKWTIENMNATDILLPIQFNPDGTPVIDNSCKYSEDGYIPDWQFMEDYIKSLPYGDRLNG